jgi:hypothetical protein
MGGSHISQLSGRRVDRIRDGILDVIYERQLLSLIYSNAIFDVLVREGMRPFGAAQAIKRIIGDFIAKSRNSSRDFSKIISEKYDSELTPREVSWFIKKFMSVSISYDDTSGAYMMVFPTFIASKKLMAMATLNIQTRELVPRF